MKSWTRCTLRTLPLFLLLTGMPALAGGYAHTRDGFVLGVDMGPGWANAEYTTSEGTTYNTSHKASPSGLFRLGWARNDVLMGSIDFNGWDYNGSEFEHQLFATTVTVTWFPGGDYFYFSGGVGSGSLSITRPSFESNRNFTERGWSYLASAGMEFRVAPDYGIGLSANYYQVNLGEIEDLTDVNANSFSLNMHIHWYMND